MTEIDLFCCNCSDTEEERTIPIKKKWLNQDEHQSKGDSRVRKRGRCRLFAHLAKGAESL
jgi:hypothetical protein